jgi:peptide/nickel transport system substrate-binding protein
MRRSALVVGAAVVALSSCARPTATPLVVAFGDLPISLDPHIGNRNVRWSVLSSFYDPLVSLSGDMKPEPALATRWEQVDPTHWCFTLRSRVLFHNDQRLIAEDVVASLERARSRPSSAVAQYLAGVVSVRSEGATTVLIETNGCQPDLLNRLSFVLIARSQDARRGTIAEPVGTGPYRFAGRRKDGAGLGRAWSGWRGRPDCGKVIFEFCGTGEEAARRLLAGKADVCHLVPDEMIPEVGRTSGLRIEQQPRLAVQLLAIQPGVAGGEARRCASPAGAAPGPRQRLLGDAPFPQQRDGRVAVRSPGGIRLRSHTIARALRLHRSPAVAAGIRRSERLRRCAGL